MEGSHKFLKEFFSKLHFEEKEHKYFVEGVPLEKSVSGVIKDFVEYVDFTKKAEEIDLRKGLPLGTTKKLWDLKANLSCAKGNKAHFFGETYAFHRGLGPTDGYEEAIASFWKDLPPHIEVVCTELQMYHLKHLIGGTADIILYDTINKTYIIGDYKTNEDLFKNFKGKTLLAPFNDKLDCNFSKYTLQLSLYQIMLEQVGVKVSNRVLIHIKPDGSYLKYFTEDITTKIKEHLQW